VRSVVSDIKAPIAHGDPAQGFNPIVRSQNDYYPFGMQMPGRIYNSSSYRFGFGGHERDDEVAGSGNHYTTYFRPYDSRLGRWWSIDPKASSFAWSSPFVGFNNNPILFVDPMGDSSAVFGADGGFLGVEDDGLETWSGKMIDYDKDGNVFDKQTFGFNDFENDRDAILSGNMDVKLIEGSNIDNAMKFNGVNSKEAQESPWTYIERESRPLGDASIMSGKSKGLLDHYSTSPEVQSGALHVVIPRSGGKGTGYNDMDFGNFLWGQAGKQLGFSKITLKSAAHINNAVNGRTDNPGKDIPLLDSEGDQRAIGNGYDYK
jgi:RHS repeat-associated protein